MARHDQIQEPDVHNFSTSSSHRLPTISGAQALQNELRRSRGISTNLPTLDALLASNNNGSNVGGLNSTPASGPGGVRRGYVTEIYGPPGVGKTTFGMQLAVNAVIGPSLDGEGDRDGGVVWISSGKPLVRQRLHALYIRHASTHAVYVKEMPSSPPLPGPVSAPLDVQYLENKFTSINTLSLPHLLTMLIHPTTLFPPHATSILVIDDLSNLLNGSFPRRKPVSNTTDTNARFASKSSNRRFQVLDALSTALPRLAASRHIAVVILNSAGTSLQDGHKAVLKPALSTQTWDVGISTRIVLYRDFPPENGRRLKMREQRGYRLAAITRLNGRDVLKQAVPFVIERAGMRELVNVVPDIADEDAIIQEDGLEAEKDMQVLGQDIPSQLPHDLPLRSSSPVFGLEGDLFQRASQLSLPFPPSQPASSLGSQQQEQQEQQRIASNGAIPVKRKAVEIADSDDEEEDEKNDGDDEEHQERHGNETGIALSLPSQLSPNPLSLRQDHDHDRDHFQGPEDPQKEAKDEERAWDATREEAESTANKGPRSLMNDEIESESEEEEMLLDQHEHRH